MSGNPLDSSFDEAPFANMAPMSEDWYDGHKVVAMPSSAFGGMSIREVVSSRNESEQSSNRPRRSSSLGRQPARPGRDIIQDVYDRMGVSYTRGGANSETAPTATPSGYDENTPTGLQQAPSFSEASDYSNANNNVPNGGAVASSVSRASASGKIKDKFSGRYRAAAAVTRKAATPDRNRSRPADPAIQNRGRATEPRGRAAVPEEFESEGRRRARSLSRGLSVRGMWPPPKDQPAQMEMAPPVKSVTNKITSPVGYNSPIAATAESCRNQHPQPPPSLQQPQLPSSPNRPKSPLKRSLSFDARPQYSFGGGLRSAQATSAMPNNNMRAALPPGDMNGGLIREEKKDNDDRSATSAASGADVGSAPAIPSIKDRISAFAGKSSSSGSSQRNSARRNTYAPSSSYMKPVAPPPPKVDIYDSVAPYHPDDPNAEGAGGLADDDYAQQPSELDAIPPSAAASAAADTAAKYMRPSQVVLSKQKASRHSTGSARKSIANSYLNGIGSSGPTPASSRSCFQQQPSMYERSANNSQTTDDMNGGYGQNGMSSDANSVGGMSSSASYGGETDQNRARRTSWQKPASYRSHASSSNGVANHRSGDISMDMVERMVDERVQTQLREVEARMEGLLRHWMDSMNVRISQRLDAMEKSIKDSLPRQEI